MKSNVNQRPLPFIDDINCTRRSVPRKPIASGYISMAYLVDFRLIKEYLLPGKV